MLVVTHCSLLPHTANKICFLLFRPAKFLLGGLPLLSHHGPGDPGHDNAGAIDPESNGQVPPNWVCHTATGPEVEGEYPQTIRWAVLFFPTLCKSSIRQPLLGALDWWGLGI